MDKVSILSHHQAILADFLKVAFFACRNLKLIFSVDAFGSVLKDTVPVIGVESFDFQSSGDFFKIAHSLCGYCHYFKWNRNMQHKNV